MSEIMIRDDLQINGVNPFWSEPPGAWSKPYKYTPSVQNTIEREPEELIDPRGVEFKCKLNRSLYPKRNIDGGLWTLEEEKVGTHFQLSRQTYIILALLLALVVLYYLD
jgi:hypothetical protein